MILIKYYKTILAFIFVLILSLTPAYDVPKIGFLNIPNIDKFVHLLMYFILTSACLIDIKNNIKKTTNIFFLLVLFIIAFFSGMIEIIQANYILGRSGSLYDFFANVLGIIISVFIFKFYLKFLKSHQDS